MDDGGPMPWLISVLLILFADYIAVCETALSSVSKSRIKAMADHGNKRASKVLNALDHFDQTISTLLVCTNIAHLAIATLVTVEVTRRYGLSYVTLSTLLTTLVVFFFAEMLPKSIAKKYSTTLSLSCIDVLTFLVQVFRPVSFLLAKIGNLAGAARSDEEEAEVSVTEDELYDLIEDMTEEGSLDEDQGDLISSALSFNDITVENVLTPRVDVIAIDVEDAPDRILQKVKDQNHSRLPVYQDSIDHVIGILPIRAFIKAYLKEENKDVLDIRSLLNEPMFISESAPIGDVLPLMSKSRQNLAIVTDHYGGTVGIITVEDILESLVGEIWDEDDVVEEPIVDLGSGHFLIDAEETVDDAFDAMEFDYSSPDDEEDLSGLRVGEWVYEHFTSIPKVNDSFTYEGLTVTVTRMDHNRILQTSMQLPSPSETEEESEGGEEA